MAAKDASREVCKKEILPDTSKTNIRIIPTVPPEERVRIEEGLEPKI